jgi:DNA-directed RNA polymerase specialized sigma24 family protein
MRLSKKKGFRVLLMRPCGEGSPYWDWLATHVHNEYDYLNEPVEANPDVLPEAAHIYAAKFDDETQLRIEVIGLAWKTFSAQEKMVMQLCGYEGRRIEDAAQRMCITSESVRTYILRAHKKVMRAYERRKQNDR